MAPRDRTLTPTQERAAERRELARRLIPPPAPRRQPSGGGVEWVRGTGDRHVTEDRHVAPADRAVPERRASRPHSPVPRPRAAPRPTPRVATRELEGRHLDGGVLPPPWQSELDRRARPRPVLSPERRQAVLDGLTRPRVHERELEPTFRAQPPPRPVRERPRPRLVMPEHATRGQPAFAWDPADLKRLMAEQAGRMGISPQQLERRRRAERGLPPMPGPTVLDAIDHGLVDQLFARSAREHPDAVIPLGGGLAVARRMLDLIRPAAELEQYLRGIRGGPDEVMSDIGAAFSEALPILLMSPEQFGRLLSRAIPELIDQAVAPLHLGRAAMARGDTLEASAQFTELLMRLVELVFVVRNALRAAAAAPATAARLARSLSRLEHGVATWRPPALLRRLAADERGTVSIGPSRLPEIADEDAEFARLISEEVERSFAGPFDRGELHMSGRSMESGRRREFARLDELEVGPDGHVRLRSTLGLTRAQLRSSRRIFGHTIGDHPRLAAAWSRATTLRDRVEMTEVRRLWQIGTEASQREAYVRATRVYGRVRGRFWTDVRGRPATRRLFERAGMRFSGRSTTAPYYRHPTVDRREVLTLEHDVGRLLDPTRAIDFDNLSFVLGDENSVMLEFLRRRDSPEW